MQLFYLFRKSVISARVIDQVIGFCLSAGARNLMADYGLYGFDIQLIPNLDPLNLNFNRAIDNQYPVDKMGHAGFE